MPYQSHHLTYDNRAADVLFQVVSQHYERRSVLVTTNLAFKEWGTVFPNAACVTALIDRLTHHAEIIATGESYRRREAEAVHKWGWPPAKAAEPADRSKTRPSS